MSSGSPQSNRTSSGERLLLTVVGPSNERRQVRVDRSPFRIGRLPDRELTLKDGRISRNHAQILLEDGVHYIEDCESRHGVFVNGHKTVRHRLGPGDSVDFGIDDSYRLLVAADDGSIGAPLLEKVAKMPGSLEGTGNLSRLSAVIDVARALESSGSVDDVLAAAVDAALSVTGAERGFLMLKDPQGALRIRVARDRNGYSLRDEDLRVPRQLLADSLEHRTDLFAMAFDPEIDSEDAAGETVVALDLRSVVCVPVVRIRLGEQAETRVLSAKTDTLGVLYMDSREVGKNLAEGNREVLQTLALEISTVLENARLLEEERKKHSLEQELQIAREIQQGLLPAELPQFGWLSAAGSSEACFQVGGDYFDVMDLGPDHWGVVLVDVSGKGVSAALLASLLQGAFFSAAGPQGDLAEAVGRINRYVCERSRRARFATAFYAVLDRGGNMRWVNAGHCSGLVVRASGGIDRLDPSSTPIGLFQDGEFPEQQSLLSPGDKVVLYSDGVSEAANFENERYGDDRLEQALAQRRALPGPALHRALIDDINAFTKGAAQADDLTLLVLAYNG